VGRLPDQTSQTLSSRSCVDPAVSEGRGTRFRLSRMRLLAAGIAAIGVLGFSGTVAVTPAASLTAPDLERHIENTRVRLKIILK
jgi:hypothetical protein